MRYPILLFLTTTSLSLPSDPFYSLSLKAPPPNFISHIFFLTAQFLHIGPMHAIKEHKGYREQIRHMSRQLKDMEAEIEAAPAGAGRERGRAEVEQYKVRLRSSFLPNRGEEEGDRT